MITCARLPPAADPARAFPASDRPDPGTTGGARRWPKTGLAATACAAAEIAAPDLPEANPGADGGVELRLADVGEAAGWDWPVPRLARFAYELGAAQARWAGRVPDIPWLSRGWLAQYLAAGPSRFAQVTDTGWDPRPWPPGRPGSGGGSGTCGPTMIT